MSQGRPRPGASLGVTACRRARGDGPTGVLGRGQTPEPDWHAGRRLCPSLRAQPRPAGRRRAVPTLSAQGHPSATGTGCLPWPLSLVLEVSLPGLPVGCAHCLVTHLKGAGLEGRQLSGQPVCSFIATQAVHGHVRARSSEGEADPTAPAGPRAAPGTWTARPKVPLTHQQFSPGHVEVTGPGIQPFWPHLPGQLNSR